ncbi:hypothetical protein J2W96_000855 [Variovorax guangxiensis]|nr:hypothetical protein [Variovorax guangxiensis]
MINDFVDFCGQLPMMDGWRKGVFPQTAYSAGGRE